MLVLLVEDDDGAAAQLLPALDQGSIAVTRVAMLSECMAVLRDRLPKPDVILLDLDLPDSEGPATAIAVMRDAPGIPIIALCDRAEDQTPIAKGVYDCVVKSKLDASKLRTMLAQGEQESRRRSSSGEYAIPQEISFSDSEVIHMMQSVRRVMEG